MLLAQVALRGSLKITRRKGRTKRISMPWFKTSLVLRSKNKSETMHFTHATDPNKGIYRVIDNMEYPLLVCL
jgi:hypothetical protein